MFSRRNEDDLPEFLVTRSSIEIGGFKFRFEDSMVRLHEASGPRLVMELDASAGQQLYAHMRQAELARRAMEEAVSANPDPKEEDGDVFEAAHAASSNEVEYVTQVTDESICVFSEDALKKALVIAKSQDSDRRSRFESVLKSAAQNRGRRARPVMDITALAAMIKSLRDEFPNFNGAIDVLEAALALSVGDPEYTIPPLLVHGEPGIGKTTFAMAVADRLGVPFDMVSAGSLQGGFELAGTSSHWSNASAGRVARLLAEGDSASPVLLIDEVDKIGGDERYSPVNTMLDLLEPRTARRFRDEALQLQFDASRLIVLMTANNLHSIPAPLLSRSQVVEIKPLSVDQRFAIVRGLVDQHAGDLAIDDATVDQIGAVGDLRKLQQTVKKAAGLAKARGDRDLFFSVLAGESKPDIERRIGF